MSVLHYRCMILTGCLLPGLWMGGVAGCRQEKPGFELISIEGTIESVKTLRDGVGEITVSYFNEKRKADVVDSGLVTQETEILINGAVAALSDLRAGDRVSGVVRIEKTGRDNKQVALKIHVSRSVHDGAG